MKRISWGILVLVALVVGVALPLSNASTVAADDATAESITLSPVSRKYTIDAGATASDKLTVVNDGKTDYDFIVYSRPYSVTDEDYNPDFTKTSSNTDAYTWVQLKQTRYHLKAGASVDVPFSLAVPARAAPGGHYGVLFAETQPSEENTDANSVVRKKRVGMLLYATVNGEVIKEGQVLDSSIPFWQLQPPLSANARVKNTGNTDFTDDTTFTVRDVFGNTKFQQTKQYTILPGTIRKIPLEWQQASWFGLYKVELQQTVLGQSSNVSGYVLIMPRYLPILLVVLILVGGVYAWVRHRKNK